MADRPSAAERAGGGRREQFKAKSSRATEQARRRAALEGQQADARESRLSDIRRVAMDALLSTEVNDVEEEVEVEDDDDDEAAMLDAGGDSIGGDEMDVEKKAAGKKMKSLRKLHRTLFFSRQLQVPDQMIEVPEDLPSWLMSVRPEGERCLLLSEGGRVEVRRKNGYVHERYSDSRLPRGLTILDCVCIEEEPGVEEPGASSTAPSAQTISVDVDEPTAADEDDEEMEVEGTARGDDEASMDASLGEGQGQEAQGSSKGHGRRGKGGGKGKRKGKDDRRRRPVGKRSYAVCDVLCWGDTELISADAECRMFWLESRFAELREKAPRRARPLKLCLAVPAGREALQYGYEEDLGYPKDSLVFFHPEGKYDLCTAVTPLVLSWRDRSLSRFVIDTPDERGEKLPDKQAIVLELRGGGYLRTADHKVVGRLSDEELAQASQGSAQGSRLKGLLRCEIDSVDMAARALVGVKAKCHVNARARSWPDSWGRIVFQHTQRSKVDVVEFAALVAAASGGKCAGSIAPPAGA